MNRSNYRPASVALAGILTLAGCQAGPPHSHIHVDGGQQVTALRQGQNAQVHYLLDTGERRHRYCFIHSVNDRWLTVYDKAEGSYECEEKSGWLTMIPLSSITLLRVEE